MQVHETLRQAREACGLDLAALGHQTRVRLHLLEAVEAGRFNDLPRGVYARAVLRSYAGAVGLDPETVVAQAAPLLPELEDPLDGLARVHGVGREPATPAPVESTEAAAATADSVARELPPHARGAVATLVDSAILATIFALVLVLTAKACGVSVPGLVRLAAPAICMLCALIAGLYFLLLGGITGFTPGTYLARVLPDERAPRGVTAWTALVRALDFATREVSILVDLAIARRNAA